MGHPPVRWLYKIWEKIKGNKKNINIVITDGTSPRYLSSFIIIFFLFLLRDVFPKIVPQVRMKQAATHLVNMKKSLWTSVGAAIFNASKPVPE